jgi:gluconate kinase
MDRQTDGQNKQDTVEMEKANLSRQLKRIIHLYHHLANLDDRVPTKLQTHFVNLQYVQPAFATAELRAEIKTVLSATINKGLEQVCEILRSHYSRKIYLRNSKDWCMKKPPETC